MTNFRDQLLRHAEYKVAKSRFDLKDGDYSAWCEAVLILQELKRVCKAADLAKKVQRKGQVGASFRDASVQ